MIKFIATDLDGTLLNSRKELPEEIFGLVEALCCRGILFAPASGRQYANLRQLFGPVADKVVFICENGALVKYRGETLYAEPVDGPGILHALNEIRALPNRYPMLCGMDCAYIENAEQPFYDISMAAYTCCKRVPSLNDVIGKEPVCKIAVYDETNGADRCAELLAARIPDLRVIPSGADWCDVASPRADKGEAVRVIRRLFGLKREECVAFGDHMNDLGMLTECGLAYVPENAYPPLREAVGNTVPSNDMGGVLIKLKEIIAAADSGPRETL